MIDIVRAMSCDVALIYFGVKFMKNYIETPMVSMKQYFKKLKNAVKEKERNLMKKEYSNKKEEQPND